mmetsp:Transcript_1075/g.4372  ORF Transcript_1075/g.4372 Transcript_1075/m.4372 type:complete len:271 (+) Transcript_1075:988-1800(+)
MCQQRVQLRDHQENGARGAHRARMGSRDGGVRAFPRVRVRRHRRRHVSPRRRGRSALDASVRRAAPEAVLLPAQHLPAGCAPGGDRHGVQARRGHHRHRTAATEHLPRVAQRARRRRRVPERRARPHHVQDSRAVQGGDARGAREQRRGDGVRDGRGVRRRYRHHRDAGEHSGARRRHGRRRAVRRGQRRARVSHAVAHGTAGRVWVFRRTDGIVHGDGGVLLRSDRTSRTRTWISLNRNTPSDWEATCAARRRDAYLAAAAARVATVCG